LFCWERKSWTSWLLTCCSKKGWAAEKSSKKGETERISVSSAHKLDGLGKLQEHAPRSEHVHLHQDIAHIRKNHLQATLLPQLWKNETNFLDVYVCSLGKPVWCPNTCQPAASGSLRAQAVLLPSMGMINTPSGQLWWCLVGKLCVLEKPSREGFYECHRGVQ